MTRRRGFALAEMIVALVIAGIIGVALTRLVVNQARFVGSQDGMMRARASARAALNVLSYELRTVSWGGVTRATLDSVDVRVPYAFGIACGYSGGMTVLSLIPPDSSTFVNAASTTSGFAWLDNTGTWQFVEPATRTNSSTAACGAASPPVVILTSPGGLAWGIKVAGIAPPVGSSIYLYQTVRYAFAASTQLPGRRALWRTTLADGVRDELVAPFDTTAKFNFLVGPMLSVRTTAPTVLDSIRGMRLKLNAQSEDAPQGRTAPLLFRMTTDVIFRNHDY